MACSSLGIPVWTAAAAPGAELAVRALACLPNGCPGSSKAPGVEVPPRGTYTIASLGHSSEVLYQLTSFLMGMAPLK